MTLTPPRSNAADQDVEQRAISRVIVISPQGLGDERYARIAKHLAQYAPELPPISRIDAINKNYFDYRNSRYKNWITDNRDLFTRLKLRFNLEPNKQDFGALYDRHFTGGAKPKRRLPIYPGAHACSLAHIAAWQSIRDTDDLCLILEDDAVLLSGIDSASFSWPKGAHVLHLIRSFVRLPPFDSDFKQLPRRNPCYVNCTAAYVISPEGAKLLLNKSLPMPAGKSIDCHIFCRQCDGLRVYVSRRPFATLLDTRPLIDSRISKWFFIRLRDACFAERHSALSFLAPVLRRLTPQFIKRFILRRFS